MEDFAFNDDILVLFILKRAKKKCNKIVLL